MAAFKQQQLYGLAAWLEGTQAVPRYNDHTSGKYYTII
jgi:hypothetical protein